MKKHLLFFLFMLLPMAASAAAVGIDDIYYNLITKGNVAEVTSHPYMYSGSVIIPEKVTYENVEYSVTSIGSEAFSWCIGLTSVTIPNSVTSIGKKAFYECSFLTWVNIPNSVTIIGKDAFGNCSSLTSVTIPNSVTSIGEFAFSRCSGLTSINIPNSITSIESGAFSGCSGLTSITIPNSVKSIGESAFSGCSGLTSITIPNSVTSIGEIAFLGCSSLTFISVENGNSVYDSRDNCNAIIETSTNTLFSGCKNTTIPNSVTIIGKDAFGNCSSLTSINIPNSVTSIGNNAFSWCSGLTSVTIPNSVTSIGDGAFSCCSSLPSITIPNSVTSMGERVFQQCSGLTTVNIPNSVTSIERETFYGCSSLTSITIPNSVKSIGECAFSGCSGLTSITIPHSVTIIEELVFYNCSNMTVANLLEGLNIIKRNAFVGCSSLKSIVIPASVQYIYQAAFSGCSSLENVKVLATTPPFAYDNIFSNYTIPLLVPKASIDAYMTTYPWSKFSTIKNLDGSDVGTPKCATPTISYENGHLEFNCETADVTFKSSITDTDIKDYTSSSIQLSVTYNISVYATKSGYDNSETATATLCWIDQQPKTEGITNGIANVPANAVLIQSEGGSIKVQGVDEGTQVNVYSINGTQAGSAISQSGAATINTNLQPGSIAIVKIGQKSVKVVIK